MVTPTWNDRERRILEHVVQAWEDDEYAEVPDIAEALDLDYGQVVRVVDVLRKDDYITGIGVAQNPGLLHIEPTSKARRAVDQWPTPGAELYDRLLEVLDERIAAEPDAAKRGRLASFRRGAAEMGRDTLSSVLADVLVRIGSGIGF